MSYPVLVPAAALLTSTLSPTAASDTKTTTSDRVRSPRTVPF
jgi:hypothetical protein